MTITDLKTNLAKLNTLLSEKSKAVAYLVLPKILTLLKLAQENKETIIKALIPFGFIILGFYACTSSQRTVVKNVSDIFEISDEVRSRYAEKPDYWGLSTQTIVKKNLISKRFIINNKIILSGGNEVFIGDGVNADIVMPRATSFDIVLPKLNKAQCIAHTEAAISSENLVKLLRIAVVNNTGNYQFEWGSEYRGLPVDKYASKDICADTDNTLIWSIK